MTVLKFCYLDLEIKALVHRYKYEMREKQSRFQLLMNYVTTSKMSAGCDVQSKKLEMAVRRHALQSFFSSKILKIGNICFRNVINVKSL